MPKKPAEPAPDIPTAEERRAAWEERRRQRVHSPSRPLTYDVSCCPPCGPPGGYVITNRPATEQIIRLADETEED
jgi:hypothetical protein